MADDLRAWLEKAAARGWLKRVEGADWDLEIGCFTELMSREDNSPALLFDRIKDYAPGFRIVTNTSRSPRLVSLTLGLPEEVSHNERLEALRQKLPQWEASLNRFAPVVVKKGPVLENVLVGDEVDLLHFPVPRWHEDDGGRFIGTGNAVITRDPDTGAVNLGTYRVQVHDERTAGLNMTPGKHGRIHRDKYHSRGEPCPIAVSVGHHPLVFRAAGSTLPEGLEYQYIGAIRGEPVEVIEEEITGLPIPADSEIVLVGSCPPGKTRREGPFGEFAGYYGEAAEEPIIEIERIYYRNDPIILGSPPLKAPNDSTYYMNLFGGLMMQAELERNGVPDVRGVYFHEIGGRLFIAVSIKQRYAGHAKQAALLATELASRGGLAGRYTVVVDEDIDITSLRDIVWAMCTRSDPASDIDILRQARSTSIDPLIRKPARSYSQSKAIIDACKPYDWKDEFPAVVASSPELVERVRTKWKELFR